MSNSKQQNNETELTRIQVHDLPQQEKELKDQEAEKVKGGVLAGEEIPQTVGWRR